MHQSWGTLLLLIKTTTATPPQRNEVIGTRHLRPICSGWAARCCAIVPGAITAAVANCPLVWLSSRRVRWKNKLTRFANAFCYFFLRGKNIATVAQQELKFTSAQSLNNYQTTNISNDKQQNDSICMLGLVQNQNFGFSISVQTAVEFA